MKCPAEKTSFAFQTFHSFRRVLQAGACSCSFSLLTGLISNLFNKKLTCLEGIHGPTFMDFVGKFQVCIYLKLYVKACETEMILACFVWFGCCLLVIRSLRDLIGRGQPPSLWPCSSSVNFLSLAALKALKKTHMFVNWAKKIENPEARGD